MARQRHEAVVSGRVDRDRHGAERGDEPVHEPVALRVGAARSGSGTRSLRRTARRSRAPGPGPRGRRPDGRRRSAPRASADQSLVEPMSVTVAAVAGAREHVLRPSDGRTVTGAATTARSAAASTSSRPPTSSTRAALERRPRARPGPDRSRRPGRPRALGGEADRRAHQADADDGEAHRHGSSRSGEVFAHQRRRTPDLVDERARTARSGSAAAASESACSGRGCVSTIIPSAPAATAARASGSTRSRRPAACDGSTITGRCVSRFSTATAPRSSVKRVERLERPDPALAQDDPLVPLLGDVLGGHQELLDRGGHAALQQHRLVRSADLGEQEEVLHVARADLDHVAVSTTASTWRGSISSVTIGSPVSSRASRRIASASRAETLERVRRGARLEGAAAQHRSPRRRATARAVSSVCSRVSTVHGPAIRPNHVSADAPPVDVDHGRVGRDLARDELVRLQDRQHLLDARLAPRAAASRAARGRRWRRSRSPRARRRRARPRPPPASARRRGRPPRRSRRGPSRSAARGSGRWPPCQSRAG